MMNETDFSNICLIIPAYQPDTTLIDLVNKLSKYNYQQIIVVNDGSSSDKKGIFEQIKNNPTISLIHFPQNKGKGAAIKAGMHFVLNQYPNCIGVVTADADGQHLVNDVVLITEALKTNSNALILGTRKFTSEVPFRSRFGNSLTGWLFNKIYHIKIADTQTGLRGISATLLPDFVNLPYSGYEFEMACLILAVKNRHPIEQVNVATIYINKNISSHFKPHIDSFKIYFIFLKYAFNRKDAKP